MGASGKARGGRDGKFGIAGCASYVGAGGCTRVHGLWPEQGWRASAFWGASLRARKCV